VPKESYCNEKRGAIATGYMEDDLGRPCSRSAIRHRGKETHRRTPPQGARDPDRKPTSKPSRPPTNRTPVAWNGTDTWTAVEGRGRHPLPSPTSNASAPRPSGQTQANGSAGLATDRDRGSNEQEARCEVLPTQDGPLPHGTIPAVTTRRPGQVLVV